MMAKLRMAAAALALVWAVGQPATGFAQTATVDADITCVTSKVDAPTQQRIGVALIGNPAASDAESEREQGEVFELLMPPLLSCSQAGNWDTARQTDAAFGAFARIAGLVVRARASAAGFDLPAIQQSFDKQPEPFRLQGYSKLLSLEDTLAGREAILADLRTRGVQTKPMTDNPELFVLVMKTMVMEVRIKAGRAMF
jgi:hypothetical protein